MNLHCTYQKHCSAFSSLHSTLPECVTKAKKGKVDPLEDIARYD